MRKWKICGAFGITLLVLAAPWSDARGDRSCKTWNREFWVKPDVLIVRFSVELDEAFREIFEMDLDWIEQNLRIHELLVRNWLVNIHTAFVGVGPEERRYKFIPIEAAERRLGKLKAALENLPYVDTVYYNRGFCRLG